MTVRHRSRAAEWIAPVAFASLVAGVVIGWLLHSWGPPPMVVEPYASAHAPARPAPAPTERLEPRIPSSAPAPVPPLESRPIATLTAPPGDSVPHDGAIENLRHRRLRLPIDGVEFESMKGSFTEHRTGSGGHVHEAVDLMAPRHTPIRAVEDGTIVRLFESKAGGHTIYQFDPTNRFAYYYAHLDRYADGLKEKQHVSAGDVIGYVGTSGNAPPSAPHLHFTIFELNADQRWWEGRPVDPYLVFRR